MRRLSKISPEWWDYTTLEPELLADAARLSADDLLQLSRPGFTVKFYDTREDFYLAEALEYITAWKQATPERPAGICGPIGPTEQLPLVARLVNELELDLKHAHFWGMDEWLIDGKEAAIEVKPSYGLTDEEVERMLIESFEHAEEDLAKRNLVVERVEAERILTATRAAFATDTELLSDDVRAAGEQAMTELETAMRGDDHLKIRAAVEALDLATKPFAQARMNRAIDAGFRGRTLAEAEAVIHDRGGK